MTPINVFEKKTIFNLMFSIYDQILLVKLTLCKVWKQEALLCIVNIWICVILYFLCGVILYFCSLLKGSKAGMYIES